MWNLKKNFKGNFIETKMRMMVTRGWGKRKMDSCRLEGSNFQL